LASKSPFTSSREDGRFTSTAGFLHAYMKHQHPALAFDPSMSREAFGAWQAQVREKLQQIMRLPDASGQPEPKHLWTQAREGYRLEKWEAYPEPFAVAPFLVLVPDGVTPASPAPGVLCVPGSTSSKESLAGEPELDPSRPLRPHWERNRMAMWYAKAGLVAVAADNPGIAELSDPVCPERHEVSVNSIWAGRHYESITLAHKLPLLDWLKQQPYVDPQRIATSGHSLGAKPALMLGALRTDVAAIVWNDFCSDWRERALATDLRRIAIHQYVPDFLKWFDYTDILASLAPRPLVISEGGRTHDLHRIRDAYRLMDAADQIEIAYYPKYATADLRAHDDDDLPESLTDEEYFEYANVDVPQHSFKWEVAVPWLCRVLGI